jgi:hypothetical protein
MRAAEGVGFGGISGNEGRGRLASMGLDSLITKERTSEGMEKSEMTIG